MPSIISSGKKKITKLPQWQSFVRRLQKVQYAFSYEEKYNHNDSGNNGRFLTLNVAYLLTNWQ